MFVDRAPDAAGDRLLVLDGTMTSRPVFGGTVDGLLAASSSWSAARRRLT